LKALAERDAILVEKVGLVTGAKYFYDTYSIPEPEEGALLAQGPKQSPVPNLNNAADRRALKI